MKTPMLLTAVLLCMQSTSYADPKTHDGFYLGFETGPNYIVSQSDNPSVSLGSVGLSFSIQIGGALTDNLILYGEAFSNGSYLTEKSLGGFGGLGAGLRYYTPSNLFFGGGANLTTQSISDEDGGMDEESELGFGANAALGYEWWVGNEWGLGVALTGFAMRNTFVDTTNVVVTPGSSFSETSVTTMGVGLSMSVTLN